MTEFETCPACGLLFEKTERNPVMQVTFTVEITPANAPLIAQLIATGMGQSPMPDRALAPPPAPAPEPAAEAPAKSNEDWHTGLRSKCAELRAAGKRQAIVDAFAAVGAESLSKVSPEKYPELWEVLQNAG
jgi:hypothetical protein